MHNVLSGVDRTFSDILQGLNCFSNSCKSLACDYIRTRCTSFSKMSIRTIQCSWQPEGHICFNGFLYPRHLLLPKGIRKDLISGHSLIDCDGHLLSERGLGVCRCDDNCSVTMAATSLAPHLFSWSTVVLSGKCRRMSFVYAAVGRRRAQTTAGVRKVAWS